MALASKPYKYLLGILVVLFALALSGFGADAPSRASVDAVQETFEALAPTQRTPALTSPREEVLPTKPAHSIGSFASEPVHEFTDAEREARYIAEAKRRWPTRQFLLNLSPLSWAEAKAQNKIPEEFSDVLPNLKTRISIVTDTFDIDGCPARFGMVFSPADRTFRREICVSPCLEEKDYIKNAIVFIQGSDFSEFGRVEGFLRVALSDESMNSEDNPLFKYVLSFNEKELYETQQGTATTFRHFKKENKFLGYGSPVAYWPMWQETKFRPTEFTCDWESFHN